MRRNLFDIVRYSVALMLLTSLVWLGFPTVSVKAKNSKVSKTNETAATQPVKYQAGNKKRALLVGVSKYAHQGKLDSQGKALDWWNLNTDYEVSLLADTLKQKFGFDEVTILSSSGTKPEELPTHANIIKQFRDKLITPTQKGDIVYFHFSGHGMPVPDDNGDEIDGMDETIIPQDYISQKDFSNNIRDDEIGKLLDELKLKQPSNVTVSLDSCFSGTATRGEITTVRGGDPLEMDLTASTKRGNDNDQKSASGLRERGEDFPNSYVFLSAASPTQTAKEMVDDATKKSGGVFTLALVNAFQKSGPNTTYRDVYETVNDFMDSRKQNQTPQIEGIMDQRLMNGTAVPPQSYIGVKVQKNYDNAGKLTENIVLQAGSLQGMTKGSKFEIYPAGTKSRGDGKPLAVATIEELDGLKATLKLDPQTNLSDLQDGTEKFGKLKVARAFETEHSYDSVLKIAVEKKYSTSKDGISLLTSVKSQDLVDTVDPTVRNWNILIRQPLICDDKNPCSKEESEFRQGLVLQRPDGTVAARVKDGADMQNEIKAALERESRLTVVKSMTDTSDPSLDVDLRLIPVTAKVDSNGNAVKDSIVAKSETLRGDANGQKKLNVGDFVMLEIENKSDMDLYVTILDVAPDGKIGPLFPYPTIPGDNKIPAHKTVKIPHPYVYGITEPLGQESFRIIATRDQTDFSPLVDPDILTQIRLGKRGDETKKPGEEQAEKSPLGKILMKAQGGQRAGLRGAPPSWATKSVTFTVVKP